MPPLPSPPPAPSEAVTATVSARATDTQSFTYPSLLTPAPARVAPPEPGDRLGTFVLQELLGSGATCHVYRGRDEGAGRPVAVKVLNWAGVVDRPAALRQLRTEAVALSRVNHPGVVPFIDFGFDPRWPYLVTGFVEGRPLSELLRAGPLPAEWAVYLARRVADALGAVWRAGVVHRDVKPGNILVGPDGAATLIDFGVARVGANRPAPASEMAGTPAYVAPEQARDAAAADHRADVYSLGVTLYEVLTGRLPFEASTRAQMIFQHLTAEPVPPARVAADVPWAVSELCLWLMAKDPAHRPQTADDLARAFAAVLGP